MLKQTYLLPGTSLDILFLDEDHYRQKLDEYLLYDKEDAPHIDLLAFKELLTDLKPLLEQKQTVQISFRPTDKKHERLQALLAHYPHLRP